MADKPGTTQFTWKSGNLSYGKSLTLETAKKMLDAGEKEAEKQGVPMCMAIADAGGNLVAFRRMDNTMLMSINIALDKALTAVFGKVSTNTWGNMLQRGDFNPLFIHERWITFPGGFPIISNGAIVGGIGVSGGTFEDTLVAEAALKAGGFNLDVIKSTG